MNPHPIGSSAWRTVFQAERDAHANLPPGVHRIAGDRIAAARAAAPVTPTRSRRSPVNARTR